MAKINKFNDREKLTFDIEYLEDVLQTEWDSDPEIESQFKIVDFEFDGHERGVEYMKVIIQRLSDNKFFKFEYNKTEDNSLPLSASGLGNPVKITGYEVFPETITKVIYK
jgi:hypothetical protein